MQSIAGSPKGGGIPLPCRWGRRTWTLHIVSESTGDVPGLLISGGKKNLDPAYCKRVLRQLKFNDDEIAELME